MSDARWPGQRPAELVPETAPFDEEQRAWLNGFLAGLLGLGSGGSGDGGAPSNGSSAPRPPGEPPSAEPSWRRPGLSLAERLELSAGLELPLRLASALPQLDCGQCGSSCEGYARALASGADRELGRCVPGGPAVIRALELLLATAPRPSGSAHPAEPASGVRRAALASDAVDKARATPGRAARLRAVSDGRAAEEPQQLRVKSQRKLTLAEAGAEIREIVLDVSDSPLRWQPGDCLAIFPQNDPDVVRALLRAAGARGQELVTTPHGATEAWRCLLEDFDITHVRDETLRLFGTGGRADEARALRESHAGSSPSVFDLLDLMGMFPGARPGLDRIVATLGPLSPRVFGISSSFAARPGELHLAVRVVRAERAGRERKGVASQYLSDGVFRGDHVAACLLPAERFVLPGGPHGPLIMLGAGTGLARFRAFLQELELRGQRGGTWLIAASACEGDESLFEPELEAWARGGVLEHLDMIKSGQRGRRIGVEDVLRKRGRRLASWLDRGAFVYACGEGKALSAGLGDTLIDVLGRQGKMSRADAAELLQGMQREGRYVEDIY